MAKKRRAGNSYKTQYKAYSTKATWFKNREKRLERQIKLHPNDEVAKKALENLYDGEMKTKYRRGGRGTKNGWFPKQEMEIRKCIGETDRPETKIKLKNKLDKISYAKDNIYQGNVNKPQPKKPIPAYEQLFNIGVINEKRRKAAEARMARIFKR